jgi:hypothetical protein
VNGRSSAWFGAKCSLVLFAFTVLLSLLSGAGPGAMSEAQRRSTKKQFT